MGDDMIKVSFGELQNLAGQISSISSQIENELSDLAQQIASLQELWQGATSEGFQATKAKWTQAAADLQQTLASIGAAVNAAEQEYSATESKNASAWG